MEAGSLSAYTVQLNTPLCPTRGAQTVTFKGVPCGPGNSLVQWEAMSAPACGAVLSRATLDVKQQADWVGQCGVPPMQISGLPTKICGSAATMQRRVRRTRAVVAPPQMTTPVDAPEGLATATSLGRTNLAKGESTQNWGMARIGALAGGKVIDAAAAIASTGYKVLIMDTGVERTHPDLNVVEFVDYVDEAGSADHNVDGHGHGTHVGGEFLGGLLLLLLSFVNSQGKGSMPALVKPRAP